MRVIGKKFLPAVLLALLAAGCSGKTVNVVQPIPFKHMTQRMSKELMARNILDNSKSYVAPLFQANAPDYGKELFNRLSPSFLFDDRVETTSAPSFTASVKRGDRVTRKENGFSIRTLNKTITVNMIAVADWNDDGKDDWIVSCLVEPDNGARTRDYYVIIPNPAASGSLRGTAVAVYQCFGLACTLYMRETKLDEPAPAAAVTKSDIIDTVPGLKDVTLPPSATPSGKDSTVKEKNLE